MKRSTTGRVEHYESLRLTVLGRVEALTLQDKKHGSSDGFTFLGDAHHSITAHS